MILFFVFFRLYRIAFYQPLHLLIFFSLFRFDIFSLYNIDTFAHKRAENKMTDSKYFTTTKKGEIFELKSELNNDKKEKKKEAVKKVSHPNGMFTFPLRYDKFDNEHFGFFLTSR